MMMSKSLQSGLILVTFLAGSAAAAPVAQVRRIEGDVELMRAGGAAPVPLEVGVQLAEEDRIYTGMDSAVELVFADASVVTVNELTDMKIAAFRPEADTVRTRLWLKAGEVAAEVTHGSGVESDFQIRTPTATCSVRGTFFMVRHVDGVTLQQTNEGLVDTVSHQTGASSQSRPGDQVEHNNEGETRTPHDNRNNQGNTRSLPPGATRGEDRAAGRERLQQSGGVAPGQNGSIGGNEFIRGTLTDVTKDVIRNRGGGGSLDPSLGVNVLADPGFTNRPGADLVRWTESPRARGLDLPIGGVTTAGPGPDNRVAVVFTPNNGSNLGSVDSLDHGGAIFQNFTAQRTGAHRLIVDYNFLSEERVLGGLVGNDAFDVFVLQPGMRGVGGPEQTQGPSLGDVVFATTVETVAQANFRPNLVPVDGAGAGAFASTTPMAQQTGASRFISRDFDLVAGNDYIAGARVVNRDVAGLESLAGNLADNTGTSAAVIDRFAVHEIIPQGNTSGTAADSGGTTLDQ